MTATYALTVIGTAHTPLKERRHAPCNPGVQAGVEGTIVIAPPFRDCLSDIAGMERLWIFYVFDRNQGWRPKVKPPRDAKKRGLFSTRSPHRPSPLGMVAARLLRVDGLTLHVANIDLLDGTPVVDIKPYIPRVDAYPEARAGWIDEIDALEGGMAPGSPMARFALRDPASPDTASSDTASPDPAAPDKG